MQAPDHDRAQCAYQILALQRVRMPIPLQKGAVVVSHHDCGEFTRRNVVPEFAGLLTRFGIDSISVNPSSGVRTMAVVHEAERGLGPPLEISHAGTPEPA